MKSIIKILLFNKLVYLFIFAFISFGIYFIIFKFEGFVPKQSKIIGEWSNNNESIEFKVNDSLIIKKGNLKFGGKYEFVTARTIKVVLSCPMADFPGEIRYKLKENRLTLFTMLDNEQKATINYVRQNDEK